MKQTIVFALLLYSTCCFCQVDLSKLTPGTLNASGGTLTQANYFSFDWSIGESTLIDTYYGQDRFPNAVLWANWSVTSGILQPYDNTHLIYNYLLPNWAPGEIKLFPVPTANKVFIDFRSVTTGKVVIQLLAVDGKMQGTMEFDHVNGNSVHSWDLSNRAPGVYMFRILLLNNLGWVIKQGTFQVEKIN